MNDESILHEIQEDGVALTGVAPLDDIDQEFYLETIGA